MVKLVRIPVVRVKATVLEGILDYKVAGQQRDLDELDTLLNEGYVILYGYQYHDGLTRFCVLILHKVGG